MQSLVKGRNNSDKYILKQWIALMARADWLVKLRISCAIYLRATREKMASRFGSVTNEKNSRLGKYPPLANSTSVNSC